MHLPPARPLPRLLTLLVALVALSLVTSTPASGIPIEDYPQYVPQSTCSPTPKRGTVILAEYLVKRYPGSGSSGIARSCTASGTSEHKEGRAFDWRLSAEKGRDRRYATHFLSRA